LSSSPGGWSQYALQKCGFSNVISIDLIEMSPIIGVKFLQINFLHENALQQILHLASQTKSAVATNFPPKFEVVMSDMAANSSGNKVVDHLRIMNLLELALNFAIEILAVNGSFIGKVFQGGSSEELIQKLQQHFKKVSYFKPQSSRKDSSEVYIIAKGFKKIEP